MTIKLLLSSAAILLAVSAFAQQAPAPAAGAPAAQAPLQIPNPHYETVLLSIDVNAPIDTVWARIGKFCDFSKFSPAADGSTCTYLQGNGEMGTVRSIFSEVMVSKTQYSYTYTQAPRENTPYNLYHATLEAVPLTPAATRVNYLFFFDSSMLTPEARESYLKGRQTIFMPRLQNLKTIAEGGTLPAGTTVAGTTPPAAPFIVASPHYVSIPMQIEINAPVDTVWSKIGHFCDLGKVGAGFPACTITSGTDGELGAIRSIGREVLVAKTKYSYTYTQPMRATGFYPLYHGTVEARASTPTTTTLYWTLVYDNSNLADDAAKEKDIAGRRTRFTAMLQNVKTLSEGGTPPPAAVPAPPK